MDQRGLSQGCQAWMRAAALGGSAGTLCMTMWEFFHRIGSNLSEIFRGAQGRLYWNAHGHDAVFLALPLPGLARLVDASLPEPVDVQLTDASSATQIVHRGPLPIAMAGADVFLATNLHGQAPCFTASLEAAIQAGAIAAGHLDPGLEQLPLGPANDLPWGAEPPPDAPTGPPPPADVRRIELSTALPADAAQAWLVLLDTESWPSWGRLVTSAAGAFEPGHVWTMQLRGEDGGPPRTLQSRFVSMDPPRQIVFETLLGAAWLVRLVHVFDVAPDGPDRATLRQSFQASGALVPLLWGPLSRGMTQFDALGENLARRLTAGTTQPG